MVNDVKKLIQITKKLKLLYVEDNKEARIATTNMLKNLFDSIDVAVDGQDGLEKFNNNSYDLILTDINMPNVNGIEMLKSIREKDTQIPCIVLSAHNDTNFFLDTINLGVDGYVLKPINLNQFISAIGKSLYKLELEKQNDDYKTKLENVNDDLESEIVTRIGEIYSLNTELEKTQREIIVTLATTIELKSKEVGEHVQRVSSYSKLFAQHYGLDKEELHLIENASPMHDIGKLGIPDSILNKNGKLNDEEKVVMESHTTMGHDILKNSNRPILKAAAIISKQHHEKYDGSGYPEGLKGDDIHIYGRVTAIADVFDALSSARPYKEPWKDEDILEFFKEEKGKHFDPKLVDIFFDNVEQFLEIRDSFK